MRRDLALMWQNVHEMTLAPVVGTESIALLDRRDERSGRILELKANLAIDLMRYSPAPRFERVEARFIEFVPDSPELHDSAPAANLLSFTPTPLASRAVYLLLDSESVSPKTARARSLSRRIPAEASGRMIQIPERWK
jgi:hypothetical protein